MQGGQKNNESRAPKKKARAPGARATIHQGGWRRQFLL